MAKRRSTDIIVSVAAAATAARLLERGWAARFVERFSSIAIRRGMREGSRRWLYVGAAASSFRYIHRFVGKKEEVKRIKLKRGETIEIREIPRAGRRA